MFALFRAAISLRGKMWIFENTRHADVMDGYLNFRNLSLTQISWLQIHFKGLFFCLYGTVAFEIGACLQ